MLKSSFCRERVELSEWTKVPLAARSFFNDTGKIMLYPLFGLASKGGWNHACRKMGSFNCFVCWFRH